MQLISPRRIFIISILVWLVIFVLSPFEYNNNISINTLWILTIYIFSFIFGTVLFDILNKKNRKIDVKDTHLYIKGLKDIIIKDKKKYKVFKRFLLALIVTGVIGTIFRFYDLIVLKSYFSYSSATDFRLSYESNNLDVGLISIISSFIFPISIFPFLLMLYFKELFTKRYQILSLLLTITFILYNVLRGGRTTITLILLMFLIGLLITNRIKFKINKINFKYYTIFLILGALFITYSINILTSRLEINGFTIISHLYHLEKNYGITIHEEFLNFLNNNPNFSAVLYTFISIAWYFTHGLYEFEILIQGFDTGNLFWGGTQFYPVFKLFNILGLTNFSLDDLSTYIPTYGRYSTFFGAVYTDFGILGFVNLFIYGFISQIFWFKFKKAKLVSLIVYPFIGAVIFHAPFLNMIQAGGGLYILFSLIICSLLLKVRI
jgi:oligosaccharide repeat unit polymerase